MRAFEYIDNNRKAKTTYKATHKHSGNLFANVTTATTPIPSTPHKYWVFIHKRTSIGHMLIVCLLVLLVRSFGFQLDLFSLSFILLGNGPIDRKRA